MCAGLSNSDTWASKILSRANSFKRTHTYLGRHTFISYISSLHDNMRKI
jgi:hypothetical protein